MPRPVSAKCETAKLARILRAEPQWIGLLAMVICWSAVILLTVWGIQSNASEELDE